MFIYSIHNTKREDVTFLAFQVWVLGMSIVALLNESIPHTLAALLTHILATAWSVYQLFNTKNFQVSVPIEDLKRGCSSMLCRANSSDQPSKVDVVPV